MSKETLPLLEINELELGKEVMRLPSDYWRQSKVVADLRANLTEANSVLEVTEAELADDVRGNPGKYGLEKVTVDAVKSCVRIAIAYTKAQRARDDIQHDLDLNLAVVRALELKKSSLQMLCELHTTGYFIEPRIKEEKMDLAQESAKRKIRERDRG